MRASYLPEYILITKSSFHTGSVVFIVFVLPTRRHFFPSSLKTQILTNGLAVSPRLLSTPASRDFNPVARRIDRFSRPVLRAFSTSSSYFPVPRRPLASARNRQPAR